MTLCGAVSRDGFGWLCTKPQGHAELDAEHIAALGPYVEGQTPIFARWRDSDTTDLTRHDMATDLDGTPIPMAPGEVRAMALKMFDEGELLALIVRKGDDVSLQVFGPPSRELLDVLERTVAGFRHILEGHA